MQDRFTLPHFVWQDFCEVIDDLKRAGYAIDSSWFLPHREFRFPICGQIDQSRVNGVVCWWGEYFAPGPKLAEWNFSLKRKRERR